MKPTFSYILPLLMMFLSPLVILSSESWVFIWLFLEVGSASFILMSESYESIMVYFLTQTIGSSMILFHLIFFKEKISYFVSFSSFLLFLGLSLKIGLIPFHHWFLTVGKEQSKVLFFLLLTLQKVAPLFLMKIFPKTGLITFFAFISTILGVFFQMSIFFLKELLLYSSITNMGWLLLILSFGMNSFWVYLLFYSIIIFFGTMQMEKMSKSMIITLLSLSGIPPLLGFLMKLIAFKSFPSEVWALILTVLSALNTFIYFRLFMKVGMRVPEEKSTFFCKFNISFQIGSSLIFFNIM